MEPIKPLFLLFLWDLATHDNGEVWASEAKPSTFRTGTKERKILAELGLIEQFNEKNPDKPKIRALPRIRLTEVGWRYLADHMTDPINTASPAGTPILGQLLVRLSSFLSSRSLVLADIFISPLKADPKPTEPIPTDPLTVVKKRLLAIRETNYQPGLGVHLANLRPQWPDISAQALDEALLELQRQGFLDLSDLSDDPSLLTDADKKAALWVAGRPRHLIFLKQTV
jgi:hypothetical protein